MELLYFTDIAQVHQVLQLKPQLFQEMRPITGDIVVAWELDRLGIPFIDEWDFLGPDDIERNWQTANDLSFHWLDAGVEYEGIPLHNAVGQDLVYPLEACLNAGLVYERLFRSMAIDRVSGFFLPQLGVVRTGPSPTHRAVRSVAQAVLFYTAERHGIPVVGLDATRPLSRGLPAKRGITLGPVADDDRADKRSPAERLVLVYADGLAASEHSEIMELLCNSPGWRAVSLSRQDLETGVYAVRGGAGRESRFAASWRAFEESAENYAGKYPEIFANPHLRFQFRRIWDEMETAAELGDIFSAFLDLYQPALALFGHEAFTVDRVLVHLAKKRGIPTVGFLHGGVAPRFGFRGLVGDADSILVWNDLDVELLASYGVGRERLKPVGCLRYDSRLAKYNRSCQPTEVTAKRAAKARLGIPPDRPAVLWISAAINAGFAAPVSDPIRHRKTVAGLVELIGSRPDVTFMVKAHPSYDYYEIYRRLHDLGLTNFSFLERNTLDEAIEAADICLMVNYCTTAALEAMLARVPVLYLEEAVYPLYDWQDNVTALGIHRVQSVRELRREIDALLNEPAARERELSAADDLLQKFLGGAGMPAGKRLLDVMVELVGHGPEQAPAGQGATVKTATEVEVCRLMPEYREMAADCHRLARSHDATTALYVTAFRAGLMHSVPERMPAQFETFRRARHPDGPPASCDRAPWVWLHGYLAGYCRSRKPNDRWYAMLRFLTPFLSQPGQLTAAPGPYVTNVIKYAIAVTLGNNRLAIAALRWSVQKLSAVFGKMAALNSRRR